MVKRKRADKEDFRATKSTRRDSIFRNPADPGVVAYLQEIEGHLRSNSKPDDRALLIDNVAREVLTVDSKVAIDAACSRILEGLMPEIGTDQLLRFLGGLLDTDNLWAVASK